LYGSVAGAGELLIMKINRSTLITIIVVTLSIMHFVWGYAYLTMSGILDGEPKYISDECWYVSAARNMLRKMFGLEPNSCVNDLCYASVFVNDDVVKHRIEEYIINNNGVVVKDDYTHKVLAGYQYTIAFKAPRYVIEELKRNYTVIVGYPYPDWDDVANYMNLEHPPLGKYFIALTMLISDNPLAWKIPSLIAGSLIVILSYLIVRRVLGEIPGLVAAGIVFIEPVIRAMSMVAMLDIYVALFSVLSLYFAVKATYVLSSATVGLAGSTKINGFTNALSIILSGWRNRRISNIKMIIYVFIIPLIIYTVVNIPVIIHEGGITKWIDLQVWALSWHTQSRPPGGPPIANPWDWFIARNPFPLHYHPDLSATPSPPLMLLTIPLTIILAPLALKGKIKGIGSILAWFWIPITMFTLLYAVGNRTQYSFYSAQVTPIAALIVSSIVYLANRKNLVIEALKTYILEESYRIVSLSIVGIISWIILAYIIPGLWGLIVSSIVLGVIVFYMSSKIVLRMILAGILGVIAPLSIYMYYYMIAGDATLSFLVKMAPYPLIPVVTSLTITMVIAIALSLIKGKREEEEYIIRDRSPY